MKLNIIAAIALALTLMPAMAQVDESTDAGRKRMSCTSIMVGKNASTDGSVMTSHTCDSWYRTWMTMTPARDYERDTVTAIYKGRMHTQSASDSTKLYVKGYIPQVRHTYRYLDTAYPCMNEKQVAMGETTIGGRDTLRNKAGMFYIEELARLALMQCDNARDAIKVMGALAEKYGYADGGECLTVIDKKEAWFFEILGNGKDKVGAVWAAQRVPDDEVAVSANIARIGKLDLKNKDYFMASSNVEEVAKEYGLWDGEGDFIFYPVRTVAFAKGHSIF